MAKLRKRIDTPESRQASIFEILDSRLRGNDNGGCGRDRDGAGLVDAGSLDFDQRFRGWISEELKRCPLSRYQVAARMSELTGQDITKTMLDSWTAESKEGHRFPAIFLPAFCEAVGSTEIWSKLARHNGVFVLPGPEALRAEIQRIEEEIGKKQAEKRRRVSFLKEMEGTR